MREHGRLFLLKNLAHVEQNLILLILLIILKRSTANYRFSENKGLILAQVRKIKQVVRQRQFAAPDHLFAEGLQLNLRQL